MGVPNFTMPISKPLVRVTKATDISDLTLECIGQPQGASHRITSWSTLIISPRTSVTYTPGSKEAIPGP